MAEISVRVAGLTTLDKEEIDGSPGVTFKQIAVPKGAQGELVTFTAIFAMSALATLAAYLLRKHNEEEFEEVVEMVYPDGRTERRTVRYRGKKVEPPEAAIIRQIVSPMSSAGGD